MQLYEHQVQLVFILMIPIVSLLIKSFRECTESVSRPIISAYNLISRRIDGIALDTSAELVTMLATQDSISAECPLLMPCGCSSLALSGAMGPPSTPSSTVAKLFLFILLSPMTPQQCFWPICNEPLVQRSQQPLSDDIPTTLVTMCSRHGQIGSELQLLMTLYADFFSEKNIFLCNG